jgi:NitT/TauT family transport system substrate-binding protein
MKKLVIVLLTSILGLVSAQTRLDVGFMPILPVSQLFVAQSEGWLVEAGIEPNLVEFQNGPAMVQALSAGQLDVAYVGIGPAMVARAKGVDIKVVASNIVEQISFVVRGELGDYFERFEPAEALERFAADKDRPARIATFPAGSVPHTVLQYWLRRVIDADPDSVEIIAMGSAQVQQALLTGATDGASILEPVVTIVTDRLEGARVVAAGGEMFPELPGAVLAVRERLIEEEPELVQALVAAHVRATAVLRDDPARAAALVGPYIGGGRLDRALVERAIANSRENFVADPHFIQEASLSLQEFQKELGTLGRAVTIDELFDFSFYDALPR